MNWRLWLEADEEGRLWFGLLTALQLIFRGAGAAIF
jgi:hypothetical protein